MVLWGLWGVLKLVSSRSEWLRVCRFTVASSACWGFGGIEGEQKEKGREVDLPVIPVVHVHSLFNLTATLTLAIKHWRYLDEYMHKTSAVGSWKRSASSG